MDTTVELATLMAEGGLDAVNRTIASLIEEVRAYGSDREAWLSRLGRLNDILCTAIYVCPQTIRGVDVVFRPGLYERIDAVAHQYYGGYNLHLLRRFAEEWVNRRGAPVPETLRLPLPYGFTTGVHGSGERAARGSSREELLFATMSTDDRRQAHSIWGREVPCLQIAIAEPLITYVHTHVPLDEIQEVRLTSDDGYTPYYSDMRSKQCDLLPERGSHLHRYLIFRDFSRYPSFREREQASSLTDAQWKECQRLLSEPDHGSNLWSEDQSQRPLAAMKRAFIISWEEKPQDFVMYEILDAALPHENRHTSAALWFAQYHGIETLPDNVRRYQGYAIIDRLAQIPVSERRF